MHHFASRPIPTFLQRHFLREFAAALRKHKTDHAFEFAMRSCVFVVFMPFCAVGSVTLGLLFKHVDALGARLELWHGLSLGLVIALLVVSYFFVKRRLHQFANTPQDAAPYDTAKDRALANAVYFAALLGSIGLVALVFMP